MKPFLAAALIALAAPASADINGSDPQEIVKAIAEIGYAVTLTQDDASNPMLEGVYRGSNYWVYFYDCSDARGCSSVQFMTGYNLPKGMSLAQVNDWHKQKRFGKVELDENSDPFISMPVNLDYGVSTANFQDSFDFWLLVMEEFEAFIGWQ